MIDCPDPLAHALLLSGARHEGQRRHRWLGGHRHRALASGSSHSSGSPNGSRQGGQIPPILSSCTSIFASLTPAVRDLLALGATRIPGERETAFRVFADPAGHPFCIVFGRQSTG